MLPTPAEIHAYDDDAPERSATETATFGLGCFWGPDAAVAALEGAVRTRVGYAGGEKPDPSYHALGRHTEVVQVDYDPDRLSFVDLLGFAFDRHRPDRQPTKVQYHNVVFTSDASQRAALDEFLDARGLDPERIETRIERLDEFHLAEPYHQKHALRGRRLLGPFEEAGYDDAAIRESPTAAKLNAYVAGNDVDAFGLADAEPPEWVR